MKIIIRFILICIPLAACVQDDVKPIEAKIDYPPLAAQSDFDALQEETVAEITDIDEAKTMLTDVLARLMNVVEIGNGLADEISIGSTPEPLLKPAARKFEVLAASSDLCGVDNEDLSLVEASVWNDVDNSDTASLGDEWSYIWNNCTTTNSVFNGVMTFTGMVDPLNQNEQQSSIVSDGSFDDYQYTFDAQIDSLNNKSVFFQQAKFLFSREILEDDNEISTLKILSGSIMGVISGENLYVFKINEATFISDEDDSTLSMSLDARYFDSTSDIAGYVDLKTTENLIFEYNLALNNPQNVSRLLSGNLDMTGKDNEKANLIVDSDETKLKVSLGGSDGESEVVDQSSFFDTGDFSLVNLTGLSN